MSDLKTIEEAFLLKLNNNEIAIDYNKTIAEILKERNNVIDFVNIKKGHSFNIVIDEIFFLEKIEIKKIDEGKELSFFINNNTHSTNITKKMLTTNQIALENLFNEVKETQKNTLSKANQLMTRLENREVFPLYIYKKETKNGILTDISYKGLSQGIIPQKIVSDKSICEGDIIKINDLKLKYSGSNPTLKKSYFELNEVVLCFENDINFIDLLLEKGQLIKNTEKRKLKY